MQIAILIDGAFYLNRAKKIFGTRSPEQAANILVAYCSSHIKLSKIHSPNAELYRIFYYDCPPAEIKTIHPITQKPINYIKTPTAKWRLDFFEELRKKRKLALRLGVMDEKNPTWCLRGRKLSQLLSGKIKPEDLSENDIHLDTRQKGVDMKIGLDISSLAYKKQAQQIILIAGDSDFVPAAKAARREGIDFILDPMWSHIKSGLNEHIDGLRSAVDGPDEYGKFSGRIKN
ncbi:NYN domain-containing protein [Kallipyga gabonensis]|uniref:NYN domain-containing protein n=1 Tax=Kallipyga gabonensis TaxID=1686287 RepID=UPI0006B4E57C|nr:NYN domain-containing protein [Kallipyga gabonensis]